MRTKILLFSLVVFLFAFSMYKTCDLLGISFTSHAEESGDGEKNSVIQSSTKITARNNTNIWQSDEPGVSLYDGENIFYHNGKYLVSYNTVTKTEKPVLTGMNIKAMVDADDFIYGVTTLANGNDILCDYIIGVSKDGLERKVYYKTESSYVTSLTFDGTNVYYTNESSNIYMLNLKENEVSVLLKSDSKADYPYFIGIDSNRMYYFNGTTISFYSFADGTNGVLYDAGCSVEQKPIIYKRYVYMLGTLQQNSLVRVSLEDGEAETIVSRDYVRHKMKVEKIDSFNILDNYLFINNKGMVYYIALNDISTIKAYKNVEMPEFTTYMSSDALYFMNNGSLEFIYINWLISG